MGDITERENSLDATSKESSSGGVRDLLECSLTSEAECVKSQLPNFGRELINTGTDEAFRIQPPQKYRVSIVLVESLEKNFCGDPKPSHGKFEGTRTLRR